MVRENQFREDLYYRISVIPLHVAPLRERREDIPLLANHFLARFNASMGKNVAGFSDDALRKLESHDWPGNVRELENVIERAYIMETSTTLSGVTIPDDGGSKTRPDAVIPEEGIDLEQYVGHVQKSYLEEALRRSNGVQVKAAELLRMSYRSFRHYIQKYGIET
jgi:two-component system response regulator PilR (NtrC family)